MFAALVATALIRQALGRDVQQPGQLHVGHGSRLAPGDQEGLGGKVLHVIERGADREEATHAAVVASVQLAKSLSALVVHYHENVVARGFVSRWAADEA